MSSRSGDRCVTATNVRRLHHYWTISCVLVGTRLQNKTEIPTTYCVCCTCALCTANAKYTWFFQPFSSHSVASSSMFIPLVCQPKSRTVFWTRVRCSVRWSLPSPPPPPSSSPQKKPIRESEEGTKLNHQRVKQYNISLSETWTKVLLYFIIYTLCYLYMNRCLWAHCMCDEHRAATMFDRAHSVLAVELEPLSLLVSGLTDGKVWRASYRLVRPSFV